MAMRYSPNGGAGSRTIVIKLLIIYGCLLENMGFECDDFMACHC